MVHNTSTNRGVFESLSFLLLTSAVFLLYTTAYSQEVIKYWLKDDGTELDIGTVVKLNGDYITASGDNDPDVIGVIVSKEEGYYLVVSSDVVASRLDAGVSVGDRLTTSAGGRLRTASAGEVIVGIALESGDGNDLTLEKVVFNRDFSSPFYWASNGMNIYNTNTGNVGIGTTDPQRKLHISSSSSGATTVLALENPDPTNGNAVVYSYRTTTTGVGGGAFVEMGAQRMTFVDHNHTTRSSEYEFFVCNSGTLIEAMTISSQGNLGIGTTSPLSKIHAADNASVDLILQSAGPSVRPGISGYHSRGTISSPSATQADDIILFFGGRGYGYTGFGSISNAAILLKAAENFTDAAKGTYITFETTPIGTTIRQERVRLGADGKLGIGTTTPAARLTVTENNESVIQTDFTQAVINAGLLVETEYTANAYTPGLFWVTSNNNPSRPKAGIYLQEAPTGTRMLLGTSNNYASGITNTALFINENGYMGIGNTNPSYVLDVNGTIRTGMNGTDGQLIIYSEQGATDYSTIINPPATMTQNVTYYLPPTQGTARSVLRNDGSGNLSWVEPIHEVVTFLAQGAAYTWTNMPAGLTEFAGATRHRTRVDLTSATQARLTLVVATAGAANAEIRVQYSTDEVTWAYLDGVSGPGVSIGTTGTKVSTWVDLIAGARGDVYLRLVGINGNGVADPSFGLITVQFR